MKALTTIKAIAAKSPIRSIFAGVAVAAIAVPAFAGAYGPSRPTFTIEDPADHVTFNSITNNGNYGDERNFVLIKDAANTSAGGWSDEVNVEGKKEYLVRVYVHNNAAANLNLVAQNTRVKVNIPNSISNRVQIDGFVSADNANPGQVWDDVVLKSDKQFAANYVAGSARYYNNVNPSTGFALSDNIASQTGALVGYNQMDGKVPGCFQYSGIATFRVYVQGEVAANFTAEKKVRLNGQTDWSTDAIEAKPGQKVDYQIGYKNTGEAVQSNVTVKDTLPAGVTYEANTTTLKNAQHSEGNGFKLTTNTVATTGENIGNYAPGANAYVRFTATLPTNDQLAVCGKNTIRNTARVITEHGYKEDVVDVIVTKTDCGPVQNECKPGVPTGDARCAECVPNQNGEMSDDCIAATLPSTGPAETLAVILAVATLGTVTSYMIKRRRALIKAQAEAAELAEQTTDTTQNQ